MMSFFQGSLYQIFFMSWVIGHFKYVLYGLKGWWEGVFYILYFTFELRRMIRLDVRLMDLM